MLSQSPTLQAGPPPQRRRLALGLGSGGSGGGASACALLVGSAVSASPASESATKVNPWPTEIESYRSYGRHYEPERAARQQCTTVSAPGRSSVQALARYHLVDETIPR